MAVKAEPHLTRDQRLAFLYATLVLGWRAKIVAAAGRGQPARVTYWADVPKAGEVLVADEHWDPLGAPFGDKWHGIRGVFLAEEAVGASGKRERYMEALRTCLVGKAKTDPKPWDYTHASPRQRITAMVKVALAENEIEATVIKEEPAKRHTVRKKSPIGV